MAFFHPVEMVHRLLLLPILRRYLVLEIFGVGCGWNPESGMPGAIWATQQLPEDKATVIPK